MTVLKIPNWIESVDQVKQQNPNFMVEKKMRMAMNIPPQIEKVPEISPEDKKEMEKQFSELYFGLTYLNWMQGGSLGAAWQTALGQIRAWVVAKTERHPDNPAAKCLGRIANDHAKKWAQVIMTSPSANETMNVPPGKANEWQKIGEKAVRDGLGGMNAKMKTYEPKKQQPAMSQIAQRVVWDRLQNVAA